MKADQADSSVGIELQLHHVVAVRIKPGENEFLGLMRLDTAASDR